MAKTLRWMLRLRLLSYNDRMRKLIYIVCLLGVMVGCGRHSVPKPYGYFRITMPDTAYTSVEGMPYRFEQSVSAQLIPHQAEGEKYWIDVYYPSLDATIHCSYKPVEHNLRELTDDAIEFVYKHASHASAIPEREFRNEDARVYGVFFELEGSTASPYQFFLTDSVNHFFRGAVYCNCRINADSLAPVYDYLKTDIVHLIETFEWK